jgi:hypothetical protein
VESAIVSRLANICQEERKGMAALDAQQRILDEVQSWPGVATHPHRFGGVEFRLGKREIGHLHGNSLLDVPFPVKIKEELIAAGEAEEHHVLPESGWISFRIRTGEDVEHAVNLLRRSFGIVIKSNLKRVATNIATNQ